MQSLTSVRKSSDLCWKEQATVPMFQAQPKWRQNIPWCIGGLRSGVCREGNGRATMPALQNGCPMLENRAILQARSLESLIVWRLLGVVSHGQWMRHAAGAGVEERVCGKSECGFQRCYARAYAEHIQPSQREETETPEREMRALGLLRISVESTANDGRAPKTGSKPEIRLCWGAQMCRSALVSVYMCGESRLVVFECGESCPVVLSVVRAACLVLVSLAGPRCLSECGFLPSQRRHNHVNMWWLRLPQKEQRLLAARPRARSKRHSLLIPRPTKCLSGSNCTNVGRMGTSEERGVAFEGGSGAPVPEMAVPGADEADGGGRCCLRERGGEEHDCCCHTLLGAPQALSFASSKTPLDVGDSSSAKTVFLACGAGFCTFEGLGAELSCVMGVFTGYYRGLSSDKPKLLVPRIGVVSELVTD
ncbi:hypothetical protein B0H17DRAFT_1144208 [Mycena rosella]|uniref:Uncharacterized protein n=1 Tax=Mycena rosella TaxID=1033263 RepID=A0AAD7G3N0_MYCRO|nr:hypothetical protein B0H17DRAFT_1144208 [Mycena rosella]